jgi:drug/metabolite transporter (DMT)-like permease
MATMPPKPIRSINATMGACAAIGAILIGASWHVVTRLGVTTSLHPVDLALIRYGLPAFILLPLVLKSQLIPKDSNTWLLALMLAGSGLPFGLLAIAGSVFAPVAHMGVLIPGGVALMVAAYSMIVNGDKYSKQRLLGVGVLTVGVLLLAATTMGSLSTTVLTGDALFAVAACLWAAYTIAFRKSGLNPLQATIFVSTWSMLFVVPIWLVTPGTKLLSAPLPDLAIQVLFQAVLAGVIAVWAYGYALKTVGPVTTAAITALLPAASAFGGYAVLGEPLGWAVMVSIGLTVVGVLLLTGWLERR